MARGVYGSKIIDLRKRKPGHSQEERSTLRLELPSHRKSSLRARRRKFKALIAVFILVTAAGIVYGLGVLTYVPQYAIQHISVEGAKNIPPRLVEAYIETKLNDGTYHLFSRDNIFLYPKAEIARSVSEYFPRILSVQISRDALMAQAINVALVERQTFALWCEAIANSQNPTETKCFDMDNGGYVFAPLEVAPAEARLLTGFTASAATSSGMLVFTGALATSSPPIGQTFLPGHFAGVLAFVSRLKDAGFTATDVSVQNDEDFAVSLASGFVVKASFGEDADSLVRNLKDVLSSDSLRGKEDTIKYVDLRFGNRVYYKFK